MSKNKLKMFGIMMIVLVSLYYYIFRDQYLSEYQGITLCLAFSTDSKYLASGGYDSNFQAIQIWSIPDKKLVKMFYENYYSIRSIFFSKNGNLIVNRGGSEMIVYNTNNSARHFEISMGHIRKLSLSHDGKILAADSWGEMIRYIEIFFLDSKSKKKRHDLRILGDSPQFICNGKILACCRGGDILFRDSETFWKLKNIWCPLKAMQFSEDGRFILGSTDWYDRGESNIQLWSVEANQKMKNLNGYRACFSKDSKFIALAHFDHSIGIYSIETGEMLKKFSGHSKNICTMCFSPNGKFLASSGKDDRIQLWETNLPFIIEKQYENMRNENDVEQYEKSEVPDEFIQFSEEIALANIKQDTQSIAHIIAKGLKSKDFFVVSNAIEWFEDRYLENHSILNAEILLNLVHLQRYDVDVCWAVLDPDRNKKYFVPEIIKEIEPELLEIVNTSRYIGERRSAIDYLAMVQLGNLEVGIPILLRAAIHDPDVDVRLKAKDILAKIGIDIKKTDGKTAIMNAVAMYGKPYYDIKIVKSILSKESNVNAQDNTGQTALMLAIINNATELVEIMLQNGANVNIKNNDNNTALMIASKYANTQIIQAIIKAGADINEKNNEGKTALMIAQEKENNIEVIEILTKAASKGKE